MGEVVQLHPCICGKPGTPRVAECGAEIAEFMSCDECIDTSLGFLGRMRPVFEAMRAVGVPGEIANETMSFLLDRIPDDAMLEKRP